MTLLLIYKAGVPRRRCVDVSLSDRFGCAVIAGRKLTRLCFSTHAHPHIGLHTYLHTHTRTHTRVYAHTEARTHTHMRTRTHTRTHTRTTRTHARTNARTKWLLLYVSIITVFVHSCFVVIRHEPRAK